MNRLLSKCSELPKQGFQSKEAPVRPQQMKSPDGGGNQDNTYSPHPLTPSSARGLVYSNRINLFSLNTNISALGSLFRSSQQLYTLV